jgi:two-component system chemotaxis response regulator CheB
MVRSLNETAWHLLRDGVTGRGNVPLPHRADQLAEVGGLLAGGYLRRDGEAYRLTPLGEAAVWDSHYRPQTGFYEMMTDQKPPPDSGRQRIVVIGGSDGGSDALRQLLSHLPADFPWPLLVVLHTAPTAPGLWSRLFERPGQLTVTSPEHGQRPRAGHVYIAPPNRHLTLRLDRIELNAEARENGFRPAIDPLFRSAARTYRDRAVGVLLSGGLDDGTNGLEMIRRYGGRTIVQDPAEALNPSMPQSAIRRGLAGAVLNVGEIADELIRLAFRADDLLPVATVAAKDPVDVAEDCPDEDPYPWTCPDCGGPMRERRHEGVSRFHCRIGHAFSKEGLAAQQAERVESALWTALYALQQKADIHERLLRSAERDRIEHLASRSREQLDETREQVRLLRELLLGSSAAHKSIDRPASVDSVESHDAAQARILTGLSDH